MKFSQRKGLTQVTQIIQIDGMSPQLRNSLWNTFDQFLWSTENFVYMEYGQAEIFEFSHALWFHFFKLPADQRPGNANAILREIRKFFFESEWHQIYDFIEWVVNYRQHDGEHLMKILNFILESEMSGYRIVNGKVIDVADKQELEMLEHALADTKFSGASAHIKRALELLADRKKPDYRNSIKESISAVESIVKVIANSPKATLADALKELEKQGKIHRALKDGFLKLYGYTSDEQGIRHAMMNEPNITQADARYMLLSCTSFANYLKSQL